MSAARGERKTTMYQTFTTAMMPEDERSGLYDPDEEFPWDCDLALPFEGDDDEEDEE